MIRNASSLALPAGDVQIPAFHEPVVPRVAFYFQLHAFRYPNEPAVLVDGGFRHSGGVARGAVADHVGAGLTPAWHRRAAAHAAW